MKSVKVSEDMLASLCSRIARLEVALIYLSSLHGVVRVDESTEEITKALAVIVDEVNVDVTAMLARNPLPTQIQ